MNSPRKLALLCGAVLVIVVIGYHVGQNRVATPQGVVPTDGPDGGSTPADPAAPTTPTNPPGAVTPAPPITVAGDPPDEDPAALISQVRRYTQEHLGAVDPANGSNASNPTNASTPSTAGAVPSSSPDAPAPGAGSSTAPGAAPVIEPIAGGPPTLTLGDPPPLAATSDRATNDEPVARANAPINPLPEPAGADSASGVKSAPSGNNAADAKAPKPPRTYVIRPGDSFSSIAEKVYGQERLWVEIAAANPEVDPRKIRPGQVIRLPEVQAHPQRNAQGATSQQKTTQTPDQKGGTTQAVKRSIHVVKPGESLTAIARQHYNDPDKWIDIYKANRQAIGPDPDKIESGITLVIPAAAPPAPPAAPPTPAKSR